MQKICNSFDVFDTLISRGVPHPHDVFRLVEKSCGFELYREKRIQAELESDGTWDGLWGRFKAICTVTDDTINRLRTLELQVEHQVVLAIPAHMKKVSAGDLIVSDNYLSESEIRRLLLTAGMSPTVLAQCTVYVSPSGKQTGTIWQTIARDGWTIAKHFGDNQHSDGESCKASGIPFEISRFAHQESEWEKLIWSSRQVRYQEIYQEWKRFRLLNPYASSSDQTRQCALWEEQATKNFPVLLFLCGRLAGILRAEGRRRLLMFTRDGCLLRPLFSSIYGTEEFDCREFISSRILNQRLVNALNASPGSTPDYELGQQRLQSYVQYVDSVYDWKDTLLFDLHGQLKSARPFWLWYLGQKPGAPRLPRVHLFDFWDKEHYGWDGLSYDNYNETNDSVEALNSASYVGTVLSILPDQSAVYAPCETRDEDTVVIRKALDSFISFIETSVLKPNVNTELAMIQQFRKTLKKTLLINKNLDTFEALSNRYRTDKGSQYRCAHHYHFWYEEILSRLFQEQKNSLRIFEIGLNRDGPASGCPSLKVLSEYCQGRATLVGFDIYQEFLRYRELPKIDIVIGDQSSPEDLNDPRITEFNLIIDDGYHASKHQQISLVQLWKTLVSGGCYVIEDLHWQPQPENHKTRDLILEWQNGRWQPQPEIHKTRDLILEWQNGRWQTSEWITTEFLDRDFKQTLDRIEFRPSLSSSHKSCSAMVMQHAFVMLWKK
jgi:hypothetical protein